MPPKRESHTPPGIRQALLRKLEQESEYNPLKPKVDAPVSKWQSVDAQETSEPPVKAECNLWENIVRKFSEEKSPKLSDPDLTEESYEGRVAMPSAQSAKRLPVNKIDPSVEFHPESPEKKAPFLPMVLAPIIDSGQNEAIPSTVNYNRFTPGERADWGNNPGHGSLRWMTLTGLAVAVLVILAVVLSQQRIWGGKGRKDQSNISRISPPANKQQDGGEDSANLQFLTDGKEKAKLIFAAYACAKSPDDFIGFTYASKKNRKLIESEWRPLGMEPGWVPGGDSFWTVQERSGARFAILEGILSDFTKFIAYFRVEKGVLKLDWKATVGYGSANFAMLKSGKGDGSEIRAHVLTADFYTFVFPENKYRSYKIISPDGNQNLWGYVPRDGELDEGIQKLFRPSEITGESQSQVQAILRLVPGQNDSLPSQWNIGGFVQLDWLDA